jgi:hypothetical protein
MKWAGHVECMGEKRNAYKVLVKKREGKRATGRRRRRGKNMDLRGIRWSSMEQINLAQDRDQRRALVDRAMNLWIL